MRAIMTYVKQNKWLVLATVIVFGGLFFAFRTTKSANQEPSELRHRKLLSTIGNLLESEHYSPRKVDDVFSKEVFDGYLKSLDPEKDLFTQSDLESLKPFEKSIDDEIHGATIAFVPAVDLIYEMRMANAKKVFDSIIQKPFEFNTDDSLNYDATNLPYPANQTALDIRWSKLVKYKILDRYAAAIEDRTKNSGKEKFVIKSDSTIEAEARFAVKKAQLKKFELLNKTFGREKRFESFLNTITGLMDPHTDYFPPVDKDILMNK